MIPYPPKPPLFSAVPESLEDSVMALALLYRIAVDSCRLDPAPEALRTRATYLSALAKLNEAITK